jgi:hypothetical protein
VTLAALDLSTRSSLSAAVFSGPALRSILRGEPSVGLLAALARFASFDGSLDKSIREVIERLSSELSRSYRNEYVYKNAIANKILLGRHSLSTSTFLTELRVGASLADCVILNGSATVYEIKTELDSPAKLRKQIADYQRAFAEVFLVTHHSLTARYEAVIEGTGVGLLTLSRRGQLSTVRAASSVTSQLEIDTMMKMLRRSEYGAIAEDQVGSAISEPNTRYFKACLEIVRSMPPIEYASLAHAKLKARRPVEPDLLARRELESLRYLCIQANPSRRALETAIAWLEEDARNVLPLSAR